MGRPVFYCNQQIRSWMRRQIKTVKRQYFYGEVAGKKVVSFDEIPVRRVDAILTTGEDQVK